MRATILAAMAALGLSAPLGARAQGVPLVSVEYAVRFSLSLPPGWETSRDRYSNRLTSFEPQTDTTDLFREGVFVALDDLPPTATLAQYRQTLLATLSEKMAPFAVIDSAVAHVGGADAFHIRYSTFLGSMPLRCTMYLVPKNGRVYGITGMAASEKFDRYEPLFERIIQTFRAE